MHSNEGLSRAPAIVVNYIMKKYIIKFDEAYNIVKERKPEVFINENLVGQLKNLKYWKQKIHKMTWKVNSMNQAN